MKKINRQILFFFLCLLFGYQSRGQTVTTDGLTVNNVAISNNIINLGTASLSSVFLNAVVAFSPAPSDVNPGTIKVYYKKTSSSSALIANGGESRGLLFNGGTVAISSFYLELNAAQFNTTGGILYAEYQTYSGVIKKSGNISVVKNTFPTGPNPPPPTSPIVYTQQLPYGGVPILALTPQNQTGYLPPFQDQWTSYSWTYSFGNLPVSPERPIYASRGVISLTGTTHDPNGIVGYIDMNEKIYTSMLTRILPNYYNFSLGNTINATQYIQAGQNPQILTGEAAYARVSTATGPFQNIPLNNYQWQKRIFKPMPLAANFANYIANYDWQNIPSATQINYLPTNVSEATQFRRLVVENSTAAANLKRVGSSNQITIYPITTDVNIVNALCCDQILYTGMTPTSIIGTDSPLSNTKYLWQKGTIRSGTTIGWDDLEDYMENSQYNTRDYLPTSSGGRSGVTEYYRRFIIDKTTNKYYVSNIITVVRTGTSGKLASTKNESISISPNPSSNYIDIKGLGEMKVFQIRVIDQTGKIVIIEKYNSPKSQHVRLNISSLEKGIYILTIENNGEFVTKKIIKE
jgi:hypothetical protein